jgi:hypothetical protein
MIEKTTHEIMSDHSHDIGDCDEVWVLKSEHEELVKKLTKEILDLSYELTELKGGVQK